MHCACYVRLRVTEHGGDQTECARFEIADERAVIDDRGQQVAALWSEHDAAHQRVQLEHESDRDQQQMRRGRAS